MKKAKPYIGGPFELDLGELARPPRQEIEDYFGLGSGDTPLNSGRAAFRAILRALDLAGRSILVPDYLCGEVLIPLLQSESLAYDFYPVEADLSVDAGRLRDVAGDNTGAVLLINYFGLSDLGSLVRGIHSWDGSIAIVLDQAQALYDFRTGTSNAVETDFAFISFRKFLSVPGGAYVRTTDRPVSAELSGGADEGACYVAAAALRHAFLTGAADCERKGAAETEYMRLFEAAEKRVPDEPAGMPFLSRELIRRLPIEEFAARRRDNYAFLADAVGELSGIHAVCPQLPPVAVPMAMPIMVENGRRDALRAHLKKRDIFCAIHWPLIPQLRRDAPPQRIELADGIMSLPIDQRYTPKELGRLVEGIREFGHAP